jgi:hypothetical protein
LIHTTWWFFISAKPGGIFRWLLITTLSLCRLFFLARTLPGTIVALRVRAIFSNI